MTYFSGSKVFGCFEKHPKVVSGALRGGFRAREVFGSFEKRTPGEVKEDQGQGALFSCPNVCCIKVYQSHFALKNHLFHGKCEFLPVRQTLMDKAKVLYHDKLVCKASVFC